MPDDKLRLALELVKADDWRVFERFAAEFNAVDFPSLRTTAFAGGDKGRDGELVFPFEDPTVGFQYSVTEAWESKILATFKRLAVTKPSIKRLIYCTNQAIGPASDDLIDSQRKLGLALEVRDQSWFTDRSLTHPQRAEASEDLARRFVDPLLSSRGLATHVALPLDEDDARLALLHLSLDGVDHDTNKGLTRSSIESLVRASLYGTRAEQPVSADEVLARVASRVPAGERSQLETQARASLDRLVKRGTVKHLTKTDEFHLSFEERTRIEAEAATFLLQEDLLQDEIGAALQKLPHQPPDDKASAIARALREAMDVWLLERGERFARGVLSGSIELSDSASLTDRLQVVVWPGTEAADLVAIVEDLLDVQTPALRQHLKRLAEGYTLFAFLRQTLDVQKVLLKVFSGGQMWLDTNIVLPLLGETLAPVDQRPISALLRAARDAGARLFVTDGVVEESLAHLNRSLSCARTMPSEWHGTVPYVFEKYTLAGRGRNEFVYWMQEFHGSDYPASDFADYLVEEHGVRVRSLVAEAERADDYIRAAAREFWLRVHDERRERRKLELDSATALRLAEHDVENSLGVVESRGSTVGPLGFDHWWLTLDRRAYSFSDAILQETGVRLPSPTISPDFLLELLRLGPTRTAVEVGHQTALPVIADLIQLAGIPIAVVEHADMVRRDHASESERIVRRKVRDSLNAKRWQRGPVAGGQPAPMFAGGSALSEVDSESLAVTAATS